MVEAEAREAQPSLGGLAAGTPGHRAAGGQIPPLPERSSLLAETATAAAAAAPPPPPPPQVTAPRGVRGPAARKQVGTASATPHPPPGPAGHPGGVGPGSAPKPEVETEAAGAAAGLGRRGRRPQDPARSPPTSPELSGRGVDRPSPRGRTPRAERECRAASRSPYGCSPAPWAPSQRVPVSAAAAVPAAEPLRLPPAAARVPSFDRCPYPPHQADTQAFCCRVHSGWKRPHVWPSQCHCNSRFTLPLAKSGWLGEQGVRGGGTNLPCPAHKTSTLNAHFCFPFLVTHWGRNGIFGFSGEDGGGGLRKLFLGIR